MNLSTEKYEVLPGTDLSLKNEKKKKKRTGSDGGGGDKKGKTTKGSDGNTNKNKNKKRTAAVVMESSEEESSDDEDDAASDFVVSDNEESSDEESLASEQESDQSDMDMSDDSEGGRKRKQPAAVVAVAKKSKTRVEATIEATKPTTATGTKTPSGVALNTSRIGLTPAGLPTTTAKKTPASRFNTTATPGLLSSEKYTPTTTPGSANLKNAIQDTGVERFLARDVQRFPWMQADQIRDAKKRRPSDPGYDHTSIHIPPDWFVKEKISAGQRQWWDFKALNWDAVLLFKMGKFYELFEMDAKVGADILGLSFMKGDQPHCGFPEAAYHQMAETLARAGRRVVVIEQTETPDALAVRNEERKKKGLKKESVVRREKVVVLTKGTLNDAGMLATAPEASYLMCLVELSVPTNDDNGTSKMGEGVMRPKVWVGMCAVDAATGQVLLGQWLDDDSRTQLRNALTALQPVEVVLARGRASNPAKKVIRGLLRDPLVNEYELGSGRFWTVDTLLEKLPSYFDDASSMPTVLDSIVNDKNVNAAVASALAGCLAYLNDGMLDKQVMAARRFELVSEAYGVGSGRSRSRSRSSKNDGGVDDSDGGTTPDNEDMKGLLANKVKHMSLDGAALENLEVLENTEGKLTGTLLAAVDNCVTPAGRRRLRQWLCRPLFSIKDITARQDAIADLMGPAAADGAVTARHHFSGLADLERSIARLAAAGAGCGSGRDAPHVVLYEDVSKKRVQAFSSAIKGLAAIQDAMINGFQNLLTNNSSITSLLLRQLVTPGLSFPDMKVPLEELLTATDWSAAERSGRVIPEQGVDPVYDSAVQTVESVEQELQDHLKEMKDHMVSGVPNKSHIKYVSLMKESHVIEVPESAKVPADWEPMQGKKGVKRYSNIILKELAKELETAKDAVEAAQSGILQGLVVKFAANRDMWLAAVECMAHLDALMSLAVAGSCGSGPMCRPTFLPSPPPSSSSEANTTIATTPLFRAKSLRHPAEVSGLAGEGNFVPNDIQMGGSHDNDDDNDNDTNASVSASSPSPGFIVLTGPNMGGKSTLMRQVCLASLLAQVGAWVPAASLEMSPVDAIFVRMGARDRIMLGQSTFFVELSETAGALARATRNSLVALDELGRGTATSDGAAIASAVLDHFASTVKCRGIFATHYHHIADSHAEDAGVAIKHMACKVTTPQNTPNNDDDDGGAAVEEVTFLYKLTQGACPKSYGVNVARLAGLPESIVKRAAVVSSQTQKEREQQGGMIVGGEEDDEEELCRAVKAARELLQQL